jgi:hypothetical protein
MSMDSAHPDIFVHIRIIVGIVIGLSITRLLTGLSRFVQHPKRERIYPIHIGWAFFVLLAIIHFWWFEFALSTLQHWTFEVYIFIILYAVLFFLLCTLLFPDRMDEYAGFKDYFHSRQKWFFGLLTLMFVVDMIDTRVKGVAHFQALGNEYLIRQIGFAILALTAVFVRSVRYHAAFAAIALVYQVWWILPNFHALS